MDRYSNSFASESPPAVQIRNEVETASTAGVIAPSPSINITDVSTSITMTAGLSYLVNNNGNTITLTFPVAPNDGDNIRIKTVSTSKVTLLTSGGQTFEDGTAFAFLEDNSKSYVFTYKLASGQWILL
jgi:hypothetical protein